LCNGPGMAVVAFYFALSSAETVKSRRSRLAQSATSAASPCGLFWNKTIFSSRERLRGEANTQSSKNSTWPEASPKPFGATSRRGCGNGGGSSRRQCRHSVLVQAD
jgi:hypothetical protein